jgi:hypothetical protein
MKHQIALAGISFNPHDFHIQKEEPLLIAKRLSILMVAVMPKPRR